MSAIATVRISIMEPRSGSNFVLFFRLFGVMERAGARITVSVQINQNGALVLFRIYSGREMCVVFALETCVVFRAVDLSVQIAMVRS